MINNAAKDAFYRDTKELYTSDPLLESGYCGIRLNLCRQYAGKKILDIGCATGNLCIELKKSGYECSGADVNSEYVRKAKEKGVDAYVISEKLPFEDKAFDTVTIFEVLEHLSNPGGVLKEAKRVARKNILISVPNCGEFEFLHKWHLTYEHFLELDHKNFFTKESLTELLSGYFEDFNVRKISPVLLANVGLPWWVRKPISLLFRLGLIKANVYLSLFAVINIRK